MNVSDFDYELPEHLIAQVPLADRTASRLLVLHRRSGEIEHRKFTDLIEYLNRGDLIVMNNTRVTALRLFGERRTGGKIEALVLQQIQGAQYSALMKPAKKLKMGEVVFFEGGLSALIREDCGGGKMVLEFQSDAYREQLKKIGQVPLPPYIHTPLQDAERYQTVYNSQTGSAAAPTSGLHFTKDYLEQISDKGVAFSNVTLDVGLDTFRPISSETTEDHVMHGEVCRVPSETALAIEACKGKIVAVGTTTTRTLETFATGRRCLQTGEKVSQLFITPGFDFQIVDALLTNFHMPRTTMLMMVAALVNRDALMEAYQQAVVENYRFLSFGDAMLIV